MERVLDCIRFESRREIEEIESALNTYLDDHPGAENEDKVDEMRVILEAMHRNW